MLHRDIRGTLPKRVPPQPVPPQPNHEFSIPTWLGPAAAALVGFVLVAVVAGALIDRSRSRELERQMRGLEAQVNATAETSAPASTPACPPIANYLEIIARQEARAQWDAAFATAQTALTVSDLCSADRVALAEHAVTDGLNALWAAPAAPADPLVQQRAVDRVETLRRLATHHGATFPLTDRQLAERAYQVSLFLLAKQAFERALATGEVAATDQLQVQFYDSTLYNLGLHYADDGQDVRTREEGLGLLLAAYRIDRSYRLGSGLPFGALVRLLGPDERRWEIKPAPTPLLARVTTSGMPDRVE